MRPRPRLLWLVAVPLVAGGLAAYDRDLLPWLWVSLLALAAIAGAGALATRLVPIPLVTRSVPASLPVGIASTVGLQLENRSRRRVEVVVHDLHPAGCEVLGLPRRVVLAPFAAARVGYSLRPTQRGELAFAGTDLLLCGRHDWFERRVRVASGQTVRVFPNFAPLARFALHAVDAAVRQLGVRMRRRRGEGSEFDCLREFREGDATRQIDWKATSRRRRVIVRQLREERDQRVVFLLDCGRRMRAKDGELTHFDHALNTVLLLAYVALRQGDSVGFLACGSGERWMPPVKGRDGLTALLRGLYDLEPSLAPFDPLEAATRLLQRQPRRALVLWITNLRDVDAGELQPALRLLRGRHLVVVASMREAVVDEVLERPVADLDSALLLASAWAYREQRAQTLRSIDARGVHLLDVTPSELPRHLVNRYLEIKRSGAL